MNVWAFWGGIPGLREIALVLLVTLVLYGRSGLQIARHGRGLAPWLSPIARRAPARPAPRPEGRGGTGPSPAADAPRRRDRVFWFLAIVAASAVAAWIATRAAIVGAPRPSP
jgi:hypothetical protein